jgi:hypothetical protein
VIIPSPRGIISLRPSLQATRNDVCCCRPRSFLTICWRSKSRRSWVRSREVRDVGDDPRRVVVHRTLVMARGRRPAPLEPAHGAPDEVGPPVGLRPEPLRSAAGESAPSGASPSISAGCRAPPAGIRRHAAPHRQFRRALRRPAAAVPARSPERPARSRPPPGRAAPGCDGRSVGGRAACLKRPTPRGARVSDMRRQVSWADPLGWPRGVVACTCVAIPLRRRRGYNASGVSGGREPLALGVGEIEAVHGWPPFGDLPSREKGSTSIRPERTIFRNDQGAGAGDNRQIVEPRPSAMTFTRDDQMQARE